MIRFLFFLVLSSVASAQKTDASIPSIGFPIAYTVSCAGIELPADAFLLRVTVIAKECDGVGLRVVPSAWRSIFSERDGARQVTLYPSGSAKLDQRRAIAGLFDQAFLVYPREVDDKWVEPVVTLEVEYWALGKGSVVVKINRFRVVEKVLEPNQTLEPTAPSGRGSP
jgi:hypothetical protein